MHIPLWTRYVPYSSLMMAAATAHRVEAALLAAFVGAETGGSFCPWVYVPAERAAGLGQVRFGLGLAPDWNEKIAWWDPFLALNATAAAIRRLGETARLPLDGHTEADWVALRVAYTHGAKGRRALLEAGTVEGGTRAGRIIRAWREAILERPVDHPKWNGGGKPRNAVELAALPGLQTVRHQDWGPDVDSTAWGRAFFAGLGQDSFMDRKEAVFTLEEALARSRIGQPLGAGLGDPAPAGVARLRQQRLLVLSAQVGRLARSYCGFEGPLPLTSVHRDEGEGAKNPRYTVKQSQHTLHAAADLGFLALNRSGEPSSCIALARLVRGWALGPELSSLGGMGIYKNTPSMLHVDVRPRGRAGVSRWAWDYPTLIF